MVAAGSEIIQPGTVSGGAGSVAYLVPWGTAASARLLANALVRGLKVKSNDLAFTHMGNRYPSGTLIIDVVDNPGDIATIMGELAESTGADIVAVDDSWVTDGPNFGSGNVIRFSTPRVAMAWDESHAFLRCRQYSLCHRTPVRLSRYCDPDVPHSELRSFPLSRAHTSRGRRVRQRPG